MVFWLQVWKLGDLLHIWNILCIKRASFCWKDMPKQHDGSESLWISAVKTTQLRRMGRELSFLCQLGNYPILLNIICSYLSSKLLTEFNYPYYWLRHLENCFKQLVSHQIVWGSNSCFGMSHQTGVYRDRKIKCGTNSMGNDGSYSCRTGKWWLNFKYLCPIIKNHQYNQSVLMMKFISILPLILLQGLI